MSAESFKRKLTAILSADVKGYSRLMGEDEAETVKTLTAYRKIMGDLIQQHRGRVIDSPGDNILAEFASVVDAVQCAVAAQNEFKARNAELPENRRMEFRIGVNLGDVIEEENRIYGDGVNIAARLEALADPGGICISKTAFDHIESKLPLGYEYLGEQEVKNIARPVGAYKVLMEPRVVVAGAKDKKPPVPVWRRKWVLASAIAVLIAVSVGEVWNLNWRAPKIEPASKEKMALPLPDVFSIAVLPFVNMSEDPKQEFLCDGMTEEIITALSQVPRLFVIARNSTSTYKGKPVKIKQVSEELGVRYVLEGSVQRSGDRVRITAQLIDALTGNHLWAESYDRDLKDIFALQDEITIKVLGSTKAKLTEGGQVGRPEKYFKGKQGLDCYLKLTEASGLLQRWNIEDNNLARRMIEEAIAMCPENPMGYIELGWVYHHDYWLDNTKSPQETIEKGIEMVQKALAMDDSIAGGHALLSSLYLPKREYDKAVAEGERAVALNPGWTQALVNYANNLVHAGRPGEAIPLFQKAIRLNPFGPPTLHREFGNALRNTGRFEDAVSAYKKTIQFAPDDILAHLNLTATYILMGREKEARDEAAEVLRINPKFSVDFWAKMVSNTNKDQSQTDKVINALRKAGLPQKPPIPQADLQKMTFPLPDKPSIAVLPFANMSGDPKQDFFCDGITEDIITALSKVPRLFVIARSSTFTYKGKPVTVKQVSEELGVQYVLEGSVQRSESRIRITAQLIDAITGHHVWAERYDRDLQDLFALQDEVTIRILSALRVKLTEGETAKLRESGRPRNLDCYLKLMEARDCVFRGNIESNNLARRLTEEAIALCPESRLGYFFLAITHEQDYRLGSTKSPRESLEKAIELARKSLALDDSYANVYGYLGVLYMLKGEHEKAIAEAERGLALNPSGADVHRSYGNVLLHAGRPEEAIPLLQKTIRLDPLGPPPYLMALGTALQLTGRLEEAASAYKKVLQRAPDHVSAHSLLAATYIMMGREKEAHAEAAEVLRITPKFSLENYARTLAFKDQSVTDNLLDALRKAGLK